MNFVQKMGLGKNSDGFWPWHHTFSECQPELEGKGCGTQHRVLQSPWVWAQVVPG